MKKIDAQHRLPLPLLDPQVAGSPLSRYAATVDSRVDEMDPVCTFEFVCHSEQLNHAVRATRRR